MTTREVSILQDKDFIFIVGSPRSGTTWIQIMLAAHKDVCTTMEMTIFDKYIDSWVKLWNEESANIQNGTKLKGLPFVWSADEFDQFVYIFVEGFYSKMLAKHPEARVILDKNPNNSNHIESIARYIPNVKFVHIIRDGRDVAASLLAANKSLGFGPDRMGKAAALWKRHVDSARAAKRFGGRYMEIRYEDLLINGAAEMRKVFDFSRLQIDDGEIEGIVQEHSFKKMKQKRQAAVSDVKTADAYYRKGVIGSWQDDLTAEDVGVFNQVAGDLLEELGYNLRQSPATDYTQLPKLSAEEQRLLVMRCM